MRVLGLGLVTIPRAAMALEFPCYNKFSKGTRLFARNFDQILFYSKSNRLTFNPLRE